MIKSLGDAPHQLKFVIGDLNEYVLALEIAKSNPKEVVIFQPKHIPGDSSKSSENGIMGLANVTCDDHKISPNVRFMPQLHRVIWGDKREV